MTPPGPTRRLYELSGGMRACPKGDHSTTHTRETSFRKAYTVATLGPVFGFDTLGAFVEKAKANPAAPSFLTIPNIILLPGAVAVKAKGEIVAAIGVGGAPGRSEEHTSELQSLMRNSYAVFCLKTKK